LKTKILIFLLIFIFTSTQGFARESASKLYNKAEKHYLGGNYKEAFERSRQLLKEHRSTRFKDDANLLAGLSLLKLNEFDKARIYFNKILNKKSTSQLEEDAYLGLADSYFLEKNYSKALKLYQEFLVVFPDTNLSGIIDSRLDQMGKKKYKKQNKNLFYSIQLGVFKKKENAKKLYRRFKKKKYSAFIDKSKVNGRSIYKVKIGKFKTEKSAEKFAKKLKRQGYETKICYWR